MKRFYKLFFIAAAIAGILAVPVCAQAASGGGADEGPYYICCAPLDGGVEIDLDQSAAGREGNYYSPGDIMVLTARVRNWEDGPVSGVLCFDIPWLEDCDILAAPCLERADGDGYCYKVDIPEPGMRAAASIVVMIPAGRDISEWTATAYFTLDGPMDKAEQVFVAEAYGYIGSGPHIDPAGGIADTAA